MITPAPGEQDLKVTLERGGGFAGIANHQRLGPVATDQLEPVERDRVIGLAQACQDAETVVPAVGAIPDGMWVQVEIRASEDVRRFRWPERKPPRPELDELFGIVARHGQWRRAY